MVKYGLRGMSRRYATQPPQQDYPLSTLATLYPPKGGVRQEMIPIDNAIVRHFNPTRGREAALYDSAPTQTHGEFTPTAGARTITRAQSARNSPRTTVHARREAPHAPVATSISPLIRII